ncbi:MAG: flagellar motor protein [Ignavibacteriota bacterium]
MTAFAGPILALAGILGGLVLEKGQIADLAQWTALLIVFGGTLGAVVAGTPTGNLVSAARRCRSLFLGARHDYRGTIDSVMHFVMLSRRGGVLSMETQAEKVEDPFLRKALLLAVDGADVAEIHAQLELSVRREEERAEADARVFENAGGYAPTIGIIGAVLGLIQVMKQLNDISQVGRGVAVAFVATIYGVGIANLILLPVAARIRTLARQDSLRCELIEEGVLAIVKGLNPYLVKMRLENFLEGKPTRTASKGLQAAAEEAENTYVA